MPCLHKIKWSKNKYKIKLDNAQNDLKSLEKLISGQKEFDDLKKIYEDMKASSKLDESQLYKKMFKQYKNSKVTYYP